MNRLLALAAAAALTAGLWWVFIADTGRVGLYDADLNRLAETPREGYCAGRVFWETEARGDRKAVNECLESVTTVSHEVAHSEVLLNFCLGASAAGFAGSPTFDCMPVLETRRLWPTLAGTLSQAFNDRYPWPGETFPAARTDTPTPSRGSDREGFTR